MQKKNACGNLNKRSFHTLPTMTCYMTAGVWFSVVNNVECKLSTSPCNISNFVPWKPILHTPVMSLHVNKWWARGKLQRCQTLQRKRSRDKEGNGNCANVKSHSSCLGTTFHYKGCPQAFFCFLSLHSSLILPLAVFCPTPQLTEHFTCTVVIFCIHVIIVEILSIICRDLWWKIWLKSLKLHVIFW